MRVSILIILTVFTMMTSVRGWVTFTSNEENHQFHNNEGDILDFESKEYQDRRFSDGNNPKFSNFANGGQSESSNGFIGVKGEVRQFEYEPSDRMKEMIKQHKKYKKEICCLPFLACHSCFDGH